MRFAMPHQFDPIFPVPPFDVRDLDGDVHDLEVDDVLAEVAFWVESLDDARTHLRDAALRGDGPTMEVLLVALRSACAGLRASRLGKLVDRHEADLHRAVRVEAFDERYGVAHRTFRLVKEAAKAELDDAPSEIEVARTHAHLVQHGADYGLPADWQDLVPTPGALADLLETRPSVAAERAAARVGIGPRTARYARAMAKDLRGRLRFQVRRR